MSPYDTPGAIALIALGLIGCAIWLIRARRADIRRREERRAADKARHPAARRDLCDVLGCGQPATVYIHGWKTCAADSPLRGDGPVEDPARPAWISPSTRPDFDLWEREVAQS